MSKVFEFSIFGCILGSTIPISESLSGSTNGIQHNNHPHPRVVTLFRYFCKRHSQATAQPLAVMSSPSVIRAEIIEGPNTWSGNIEEMASLDGLSKASRLGLGKKRRSDKEIEDVVVNTGQTAPSSTTGIFKNHPYQSPSSPQRSYFSSSPRISSPAESQIFERDVSMVTKPISSDQIPPVLDALSEIITNDTLNPDNVEIITAHPPASVIATGTLSMDQSWTSSWDDELILHPDKDEWASNHGALDSTDIWRLSFISFTDIMQSELHVGSRDSFHVAGLSSLSSGYNRSPSPMRSPVSSQGFTNSPPMSNSASIHGFEAISPIPSQPTELTVETTSQILRRSGSGDLSGYKGQPLSPSVSDEFFEPR